MKQTTLPLSRALLSDLVDGEGISDISNMIGSYGDPQTEQTAEKIIAVFNDKDSSDEDVKWALNELTDGESAHDLVGYTGTDEETVQVALDELRSK